MASNNNFSKFFSADMFADLSPFGGLSFAPGLQTLLDAQRKNLEAFTEAHQLVLETAQACFTHQTELLSSMLRESSAMASDIMSQSSAEQKVARQADLMKKNYEQSVAGFRELADMLNKSGMEASGLLSKRVSASISEMKTAMEKSAKAHATGRSKVAA